MPPDRKPRMRYGRSDVRGRGFLGRFGRSARSTVYTLAVEMPSR